MNKKTMETGDLMQDSFNRVKEKYGLQNAPKRLVEEGVFKKEFEANGVKYVVCSPEMCFNFDKQIAYNRIKIAFDTCNTPQQIVTMLNTHYDNVVKLMGAKDKRHDFLMRKLVKDAMNSSESFKVSITKRYPPALFWCTLFVLAEGEDLSEQWTFEKAEKKIDDWFKENYSVYDFFCLALFSSDESVKILEQNLDIEIINSHQEKNQKEEDSLTSEK